MSGKSKKKTRGLLIGIGIIDIIAIIIVLIFFIRHIRLDDKDNRENVSGKDTEYDVVSDDGNTTFSSEMSEGDTNDNELATEALTDIDTTIESADEAQAYADEMLAGMTLHDKVCQMFIVTPEAATGYNVVTAAGEASRQALMDYPVCGYIYFAQNLESVEQTKTMLENVKQYGMEANGIPFFTAVDEEGGAVARCADELGTTAFSPMYNYCEEGVETAYNNAFTIAGDISELGFNLDFAPVADTWSNSANTVIGTRAYSTDYNEAASLVASAVRGFNDGGVVSCLKHFPGHGDTNEDSHRSAAYIHKPLSELTDEDYLPFIAGIDADAGMVMIGHLYLSDEDIISEGDELPASLNYKVISGELRERLGYDGVVITDALNMGAISNYYTSGEAVKLSVKAGADIMLMPADFKPAVTALEEAVEIGEISEARIDKSVQRILMLKYNKLIKE